MSYISDKMSAFFSWFTGRYAPAFITLMIVGGIFFFYFNVVVTKNEAELKERNFRGLHRMANNIAKKIDSYTEENSKNFLKALKRKATHQTTGAIEEQYGLIQNVPDPVDSVLPKFFVKFSNGWKFFFKDTGSVANESPIASASIEQFIKPLLRDDLFQHYFLAVNDTILWDQLDISHQSVSAYLTGTSASDSVSKGETIQTGDIRQIEIQGKEYKLFLLPFIAGGQYRFSLGGYMPLEKYKTEKKYVPTYAIVWLVIGIMLVILMFPLLKIFLMHRTEQLHARNAVYSLGSIHILGSIVILAALNTYMYFTLTRSKANDDIQRLAYNIDSTFTHEIDTALMEMDSAEQMLIRHVNDTGRLDKIAYKPVVYPYLLHITWADASGKQRIRWATTNYAQEKINISSRDYFQVVKENKLWRRKNTKPFYLTEISSRIENKNLALISRPFSHKDSTKRLDSLIMISLSSPFRSMFNPVLPDEFGFCIINQNGDVLFHLDETRNLNENLIEECDNDPALVSLLQGKSEGHFGARYTGTDQRFYVKPIEGTPYSIVAFRDMKPLWSEDLDIISACSIFMMMNLAVILIGILIIQIVGYRQSLLQHQSTSFSWLQPDSSLIHPYQRVSVVYGAAIILQGLFFALHKSPDQLCQVGISFSYAFILISYAYYQFTGLNFFAGKVNEKKLKYGILIWLGNLWHFVINLLGLGDNPLKPQAEKPFRVLAIFYLVANSIFFVNLCYNKNGWGPFLFSQVALFVTIYIVGRIIHYINSRKNIKKGNNPVAKLRRTMGTVEQRKNYRWWYRSSILGFIAATAIAPSVIFYFMSFKEERLLSLKHSQLDFANRLALQSGDTLSAANNDFHISYQSPFFYQSFATAINKSDKPCTDGDLSKNHFEVFYKSIKPSFSTYSTQIEFLKDRYDSCSDFNWAYSKKKNEVSLHYKIIRTTPFPDSTQALDIHSPIESGLQKTAEAIRKDSLSFIGFLGILLLLLLGYFFLLRILLKRIFFDGYNDAAYYGKFENEFVEQLPEGENVYVTGLVNSGKHRAIKAFLEKNAEITGAKLLELDIATMLDEKIESILKTTDEFPKVKRVILIRHFEMYMNDLDVSNKKLSLLESLLREKDQQIVILSARAFESMDINIAPDKDNPGKDMSARWLNVMNKFYITYHHWKQEDEVKKKDKNKSDQAKAALFSFCNTNITQFFNEHKSKNDKILQSPVYLETQLSLFLARLDEECSHSDFLRGLRDPILKYLQENKEECFHFDFKDAHESHMIKIIGRHFDNLYENTCLQIQSLAHNYYLATWQSLCPDEQRTMYDIAVDEMVNPANRDIATRLADMGLTKRLTNTAGYEIMSKSFRNFIFTRLDKKEILRLREEAAEKGSWNSFQLPVLIVVIALGAFLFTTQRDSFTNLVAYLGAALGGVGALLKLLGVMPSQKG